MNGVNKPTIFFETFDLGNHFAIQFSGSRMVRRTFARAMIVRQVLRVGSITNSPLCALLNGEEAKGAVTFAR